MTNEKKSGSSAAGIGCGVVTIALGIVIGVSSVIEGTGSGPGFGLVLMLGFLLVGLILIKRAKYKKKLATDSQATEKNYLEQFGPSVVMVPAGRYVTGHPTIAAPVSNVRAIVAGKDAILYIISETIGSTVTAIIKELGRIPLQDVSDIRAEDRSSFESSVTATRVLALGVLALAAKKKEKHESHYVTISWRDGKFTHMTVFEFEGPQSPQLSNALRNLFIQGANAVESTTH